MRIGTYNLRSALNMNVLPLSLAIGHIYNNVTYYSITCLLVL